MLVLNKGQRNIDGIFPNQTKEIPNELAERLLKMYANEIIAVNNTQKDNSENEKLKAEIEILKSKIVELSEKTINKEDCNCACDIEKLRHEYLEKFNKEVPHNMKNNADWIKSKITEF